MTSFSPAHSALTDSSACRAERWPCQSHWKVWDAWFVVDGSFCRKYGENFIPAQLRRSLSACCDSQTSGESECCVSERCLIISAVFGCLWRVLRSQQNELSTGARDAPSWGPAHTWALTCDLGDEISSRQLKCKVLMHSRNTRVDKIGFLRPHSEGGLASFYHIVGCT